MKADGTSCAYCDNGADTGVGCIEGAAYGNCSSPNCYGMCEYQGLCDCLDCHPEHAQHMTPPATPPPAPPAVNPLTGDVWSMFRADDFSPRNDPDGSMAERYHRTKGEWPLGSRQRYEADQAEQLERARGFDYDVHPSVQKPSGNPLDDMLVQTIMLRARDLRIKIKPDTDLMRSLRLYEHQEVDFLRGQLEEAVYVLEAHVLGEDLRPEHVTDTREVTTSTEHFGPATWRDFWKLTYGHRWWARWWVRRHPPRIIGHPLTSRSSVTAEFDLRKYRLYPHADIRVRDRLGKDTIMFPVPQAATFTWERWTR